MRLDIVGYFDSPDQIEPAHDPGLTAPCVVCAQPLGNETEGPHRVRNTSLMWKGGNRCYFYRYHHDCYFGLDEKEREAIEHSILEGDPADG